jgi:hypothetical protein
MAKSRTKLPKGDNMNNTLWIVVSVLALLLGGLFGAYAFSTTEVVETQKVIVQEKLVPVQTVKEVEVIKEVEVEKDLQSFKDEAIDLCLEEFIDDLELDKFHEAYVLKTSDKWSVSLDDKKDKEKVTVVLGLTFRVLDELEETRSTVSKTCEVKYEADKDTKVKLS